MTQFPRADFPLINEPPYKPFCYADNAATTQMPHQVIHEMAQYARMHHSNVHRAPYRLGTIATELYEQARGRLAKYFGAEPQGVIYTKNATEALNLLASSLSRDLGQGDAVILSLAEHHSAIVPWQQASKRQGFDILWLKLNGDGQVCLTALQELLKQHQSVKGVAVMAASNVTGVIQPIEQVCQIAKSYGAWSIIDACQMALDPHLSMACGADFMVVSAHKMFGPTGVGALLASLPALKKLPEYQVGGGMIRSVTTTHYTAQQEPQRFEAGTPPLQAVFGFDAAIKYIESFDKLYRMRWTKELVEYGLEVFSQLEGYQLLYAQQHQRVPVFSLTHEKLHPHDLGTYLDHLYGIAARAGHHCAMPLMGSLGLHGTLRLSFSWYNTTQEIDYCAKALKEAKEFFNA